MEALTLTKQNFIEHHGMLYMDSEQIGTHLGFGHPIQAISKIFERNREELEPFSMVVNLTINPKGGNPNKRLFDEHGCYLVAMMARTEKARAFRKGLAEFLRNFRIRTDEFNRMNDEYGRLRKDLAKLKLAKAFSNGRVVDPGKMKRMIELKEVLSGTEMGILFNMSRQTMSHYLKLHRESQGDFEDRRTGNLLIKKEISNGKA